jgi:hypothetical protein
MKFCSVVPEICCGQVHGARKERRIKKHGIKMGVKIQHCPISSKFDMWVDSVSDRFGRLHNR